MIAQSRGPFETFASDRPPQPRMTLRDWYLYAIALAGVLVAVVTEALSAVRMLSFWPLLLTWTVIAVVCLCVAGIHAHRFARARRGVRTPLKQMDLVIVAWVGVVIALTGTLALAAVPTTADSLIYHLARVAHWMQNRTVAFYPTPTFHQLYLSPWAEYAILHLFILSRDDRLANLVQWGAWSAA